MVQGRRATEGEAPTSVWMDPPSADETRDLLVVLQAMRTGAFTLRGIPGVELRGILRVRGVDRPPRQGIATPVPTSPESLTESSPGSPARPPSPMATRTWCPARALAALTVATLAAGTGAAVVPLSRARAPQAGFPAHPPGSAYGWARGAAQGARPRRARAWCRWRPAHARGGGVFDPTLGFPGEGPQMPSTAVSPKAETLTLVTANVTSWPTGVAVSYTHLTLPTILRV